MLNLRLSIARYSSISINNYNDLLLYAFGEVGLSKNKYKGKSGLEQVAETLRKFKENNNKLPRTTDKEMNGIRKALYRGGME